MSGEATPSKLASKRKQPEAEATEATPTTEPKQKKSKKSKKSKDEVAKTEGEAEVVKDDTRSNDTKKGKKARKEEPTPVDAEQPEPTAETTTSVSTEREPSAKTDETPAAAPLEPKKKKERKRNKNNRKQTEVIGNGTPEEDASLTEQAQKGIQYAWLYKHRHPKSLAEGDAKDDGTYWKFNKARQGWLWKNVWNEEIIPAKYAELVIEYLSSMQGQARQKLLDEAQKIVDTPVKSAEEETTAEKTTQTEGEAAEPSTTKEGEEATGETETEEAAAPETVSPEKHRRAELVVDALKAI